MKSNNEKWVDEYNIICLHLPVGPYAGDGALLLGKDGSSLETAMVLRANPLCTGPWYFALSSSLVNGCILVVQWDFRLVSCAALRGW